MIYSQFFAPNFSNYHHSPKKLTSIAINVDKYSIKYRKQKSLISFNLCIYVFIYLFIYLFKKLIHDIYAYIYTWQNFNWFMNMDDGSDHEGGNVSAHTVHLVCL
jgi:hypothetical protein